jgi:hypothetical protein
VAVEPLDANLLVPAALDDPRDSGGIVAVAFVGLHLRHGLMPSSMQMTGNPAFPSPDAYAHQAAGRGKLPSKRKMLRRRDG